MWMPINNYCINNCFSAFVFQRWSMAFLLIACWFLCCDAHMRIFCFSFNDFSMQKCVAFVGWLLADRHNKLFATFNYIFGCFFFVRFQCIWMVICVCYFLLLCCIAFSLHCFAFHATIFLSPLTPFDWSCSSRKYFLNL